MELHLTINGSLKLVILDYYSEQPLDEETTLSVFDNLQQGEYIISLRDRNIFDINNLSNPLYKFDFEVLEDTEYEFEEAAIS